MSAFAFIKKTSSHSSHKSTSSQSDSSPPLSPSLIEELYDSQQLNTFVNQSRTFSTSPPVNQSGISSFFSARNNGGDSYFASSSSSKKKNKSARQPNTSYFSFIDDLEEQPLAQQPKRQNGHSSYHSSRTSSPLSTRNEGGLKKSAFAFISQSFASPAINSNNHSSSTSAIAREESSPISWSATASPSTAARTNKRTIKPNNEMKLISANSSFHRLQTEKSNQLDTLSRLYTKQLAVYDQITTLRSKIHLVEQQKDTALANEDFLIAETLQHQEQKMSSSLGELSLNTALQSQIHTAWHRIAELVEKEAELAQQVAECCDLVKQERTVSLNKLNTDRERMHQQRLQVIGTQRDQLESEKSEVAFELGIWEQSDQDLVEREEDAVHEETVKRKALEAQTELVQSEIDELKAKLKALELEKTNLMDSMTELDKTVQEKLKPFKEERREHEQEFEQIEQRREEIEYKATQLDQQDTKVDTEMTQHEEEKQRSLKELDDLEDQITAMSNKTSNDSVLELLKEMEARDASVSQHKSELQKHREIISQKRKIIDSINHGLYAKQQKRIQLDETIIEMTQKLKSLGRHKQLAIEAGRFQNAAAWTNQIKVLEKDLNQLKESLSHGEQEGEGGGELEKEQEELISLEQEYDDLEKRKNMEINVILEKSKEDLEKKNVSDKEDEALKALIENELKLIGVQLDVIYQQQDLVSFS